MLDTAACPSLVGSVYPTSGAMLFVELDAFLERTPSDLPRRLLEHNRSPARRRGVRAGMDVLFVDSDVVVSYDSGARGNRIDVERPVLSGAGSGPTWRRGAKLRVRVDDYAPGVSREVRLPLQVLLSGWGDVNDGYQCYTHSLVFRDPAVDDGSAAACKTFAGVGTGNWMQSLQTFERVAFAGGSSRRASATLASYLGDAHVTLVSELFLVNQAEAAALAWEEALVDRMKEEGTAWNRLDGGLKGMRQLHREGLLATARVSVAQRDEARLAWRARRFFGGTGPRAARGADADVILLTYHESELTPAQAIEARRMAARGQPVPLIAQMVGSCSLGSVLRALTPISPP